MAFWYGTVFFFFCSFSICRIYYCFVVRVEDFGGGEGIIQGTLKSSNQSPFERIFAFRLGKACFC